MQAPPTPRDEEILDPKITLTVFQNEEAVRNGRRIHIGWRRLYETWSRTKMLPAARAKMGQKMLFPGALRGGRAGAAYVEGIDVEVLEFDNMVEIRDPSTGKKTKVPLPPEERCTIAQAADLVRQQGWTAIIVTSYSHAPDHHRFRVYILVSRTVMPAEHPRIQRHLHRLFAVAGLLPDPATMSPGLRWFGPMRREGREYVVEFVDGLPINVDALLATLPAEPRDERPHRNDGTLARYVEELKAKIDLVDLLKEHGERFARRERSMFSPFRDDGRRPACAIYPDHFFDFGANESYDVIRYWQEKHGKEFSETLDDLADKVGVPRFERSTRAQSSSPLVRMPREQVLSAAKEEWPDGTAIHMPVCDTVEEVTRQRRAVIDAALKDPSVCVIVDRSPTGTGKTTSAQDIMIERDLPYRALVPRDENKTSWVDRVPRTVPIAGRRPDKTCDHPELGEVMKLRESVEKTLCKGCPARTNGCTYWKQFDKVADVRNADEHARVSLALAHQHGLSDLDRLDVDALVDVVDEDPLSAVVDGANVDLDVAAIRLFRTRIVRVHEGETGEPIDVDFEMPFEVVRRAASRRIERLVDVLETLLRHATIMAFDPASKDRGVVADLSLGALLHKLAPDLGDLLDELTTPPQRRRRVEPTEDGGEEKARDARATDLERYNGDREELHEHTRRAKREEMIGHYVPPEVGRQWTESVEDVGDLLRWHDWSERHGKELKAVATDAADYRRPVNVLPTIIDALREVLRAHAMGYPVTSPVALIHEVVGGTPCWYMRVTTRQPILGDSPKRLILSATARAEGLRVALGDPSEGKHWVVFAPVVTKRERRIVIADRLYGKSTLLGDRNRKTREQVFESVREIIRKEFARTGLPVAVIGPSEILNAFVEWMIGRPVPKKLRFPLHGDRATRLEELHEVTRAHRFLPGYAYGISGSNAFVSDGKFVRALVLLGAPIPPLTEFALKYRGLYAGADEIVEDYLPGVGPLPRGRPVEVDWTPIRRTVHWKGTLDEDGTVLVSRNVPGFRDPRANELLRSVMEAEIVQIIGRLRSVIGDGTVEPVAYMFSGVAIEGFEVDEVLRLEELRTRLGLEAPSADKKPRGRPPKMRQGEALVHFASKLGRTATLKTMVKTLLQSGSMPRHVEREVARLFEEAGLGALRDGDGIAIRQALAGM
jgi:hypothetical protein